jgi:hypothetical protein
LADAEEGILEEQMLAKVRPTFLVRFLSLPYFHAVFDRMLTMWLSWRIKKRS